MTPPRTRNCIRVELPVTSWSSNICAGSSHGCSWYSDSSSQHITHRTIAKGFAGWLVPQKSYTLWFYCHRFRVGSTALRPFSWSPIWEKDAGLVPPVQATLCLLWWVGPEPFFSYVPFTLAKVKHTFWMPQAWTNLWSHLPVKHESKWLLVTSTLCLKIRYPTSTSNSTHQPTVSNLHTQTHTHIFAYRDICTYPTISCSNCTNSPLNATKPPWNPRKKMKKTHISYLLNLNCPRKKKKNNSPSTFAPAGSLWGAKARPAALWPCGAWAASAQWPSWGPGHGWGPEFNGFQ